MKPLIDAAWDWADRCLARQMLPAQVDIDGLIDADLPPQAVALALECGQAALERVMDWGPDVNVLVVVPLDYSDQLAFTPPSVSDLVAAHWAYGPGVEVPGLYLVGDQTLGTFAPGEEYRCGLASSAVPADFAAYYRCSRSAEEAERGWEFSRVVIFRSLRKWA